MLCCQALISISAEVIMIMDAFSCSHVVVAGGGGWIFVD
jgi:hypothetical protein